MFTKLFEGTSFYNLIIDYDNLATIHLLITLQTAEKAHLIYILIKITYANPQLYRIDI
jgi:hypothetical protein